jgi:hypothetical protein
MPLRKVPRSFAFKYASSVRAAPLSAGAVRRTEEYAILPDV